ncbi:MCE family protein [Amycolatopsis aidingensis]|uniref:MCE family protein n=1 Tax=Amycolatopsis aidingensis TaxID=2842453 RepID=UPI001C0DE34E|nr:MCE family protein [Amycolatopsis aidingensis]
MKSFQKRNPIPIALVGITVIVLGMVAALNSDDLPLIGSGTTYTADFSEAAGLQPDDEVRIAGIKVGKVSDIELNGDRVRVSFQVKDAWLGDRTNAMIKIKTLLGQKYVALDPVGQRPLRPAETIPLERTTAPYDVLEAFRGLSTTVDEIDTDQLAQSFDVLSETLSDTPDDVRGALTGLSQLSETIAKRDNKLAALLANTRQISGTLADRDAQVKKLIEDGNQLLREISRRKQAISTLLQGTQTLSTELQGLIDDNNEQLGPVLDQLDQLTTMLQRNQDALGEGLKQYAPFLRLFNNTIGNGRWFDNYICGLLLPSVGPLNEEGCNAS